jgi:predicted acylesterase/phospholipase RssA
MIDFDATTPTPPPHADRPADAGPPAGARPGTGVGLAMAGGVVEGGFYEVGVLCALEESVDGLRLDALDAYVGVSSGALLSSLLANGVSPRTLSRAIVSQAGPELDLRPELLFDFAWGEYARAALRAPRVLAGAVRRLLARPVDESPYGLLMELGAAVPSGLFAGRAIEAYLERALAAPGRTNDFRRLRAKLRVVAVDLDSAGLVDFGAAGTAHVPISRAVRASIALPGLYGPVEIDGRHYIDGVARKTMHASVALDDGVGLLLCVNPIVPVDVRGPGGVSLRAPLTRYGLPAVLSQTFRTLVHSRMTKGFEAYRHAYPDADVVLVEPAATDHRLFFSNIFSFSNRRGVTEHAYQSTRRWLRANAASLGPVLARHGLTLREDVLADRSRTLYPDRRAGSRGGPGAARPASTSGAGIGAVLARLDAALDRVAGAEPG